MQKVEGSSPFIRSSREAPHGAFVVSGDVAKWERSGLQNRHEWVRLPPSPLPLSREIPA